MYIQVETYGGHNENTYGGVVDISWEASPDSHMKTKYRRRVRLRQTSQNEQGVQKILKETLDEALYTVWSNIRHEPVRPHITMDRLAWVQAWQKVPCSRNTSTA